VRNGTIAELLVVMARHPSSKKISAFVVEASSPGIRVVPVPIHGLKALANAVLSFNVRVPRENLIGAEARAQDRPGHAERGAAILPAGDRRREDRLGDLRKWAGERVQ
jgi:alkylation response protein AidB-like acyl-CoA dehydrogenase